ncbi:mitochondrial Homoaconitase [Schaereria dolodes]|nr:mitochondrial Homoaconitase [Schaereria dolodes]
MPSSCTSQWRSIAQCISLPHDIRSPFVQHYRPFASIPANAKATQRKLILYGLTFLTGFGSFLQYAASKNVPPSTALSQCAFSPYVLRSKEPVSSTSSVFTLTPSAPADNHSSEIWKRGVWSVQIKQPQLQIARAYTPLPPSQLNGEPFEETSEALRFLIRRDPKGEVSRYLHKLPERAEISLRGPNLELDLPERVDEVIFLAGGTGIAPALQVANVLFQERSNRPGDYPKMHILWACRKREDCQGAVSDTLTPTKFVLSRWKFLFAANSETDLKATTPCSENLIVKEILAHKSHGHNHLRVDYFIDEEGTFIERNILKRSLFPPSQDHPNQQISPPTPPLEQADPRKQRLIIVSGPEGFVEHFAGPKLWRNGKEEQGDLGGLLGELDLEGWNIWKL